MAVRTAAYVNVSVWFDVEPMTPAPRAWPLIVTLTVMLSVKTADQRAAACWKPATILALADAVVEQLNATAFSQPLVAVRHYQLCFELAEMTELRVSVMPRSVASKALDRNRDGFDYRIDVAVQRKVEPSVGNRDALMERVEEIAAPLSVRPWVQWTSDVS
jgi:hypothetical protein